MLSKLIRRVAGSLCLVFAAISLVAVFEVVEFNTADLIAGFLVGLLMVALPAWAGLRLLDLRPTGLTKPNSSPSVSSRSVSSRSVSQPLVSQVPPPPPMLPSDNDELEVDVLQLARKKGGRLTVLEVVTELEVGVDQAETVLEDLQVRGIAGILVSDSGLMVYSFHELQHLGEKDAAQPVTGRADLEGS